MSGRSGKGRKLLTSSFDCTAVRWDVLKGEAERTIKFTHPIIRAQLHRFGRISKEKAEKAFEKTKQYDQVKNSYCQEKGYHLLRIKYDEDVASKLIKWFEDIGFEYL
eukprot:g31022.t1